MIKFKDYSTSKEIPYSQFDAKRSEMSRFSRFLVITGIFIATIGIVSMVLAQPGTTAFYLGSAEALLGVALVIGTLRKHHQNNTHLQKLPLPQAKSIEEYVSLLDIDAGNRYGFDIPDMLKKNRHSISGDIELDDIYLKNGKSISFPPQFSESVLRITGSDKVAEKIVEIANREPDPLLCHTAIKHLVKDPGKAFLVVETYNFQRRLVIPQNIPKQVEPHINEALFKKMSGILQGRYSNKNLCIEVEKRKSDTMNPSVSTQVDVVEEKGKWYINVRQLFQITFNEEYPTLYLTAILKVDIEKGSGRLTWHSPETNCPSLN